MKRPIRLAIVDDHSLFRKGLIGLIQSLHNKYEVVSESANGKEFILSLNENNVPDIVICDISMPEMDGFAVAKWLKNHYPNIHLLILTMLATEETIISMLRIGIKGYLTKDVEPEELDSALQEIANKGFYYTQEMTGQLIEANKHPERSDIFFSTQELKFMKYACSDLTYKEIAQKMALSAKTVDGYRSSLFSKLQIKSRIGLVLYAIKNNISLENL